MEKLGQAVVINKSRAKIQPSNTRIVLAALLVVGSADVASAQQSSQTDRPTDRGSEDPTSLAKKVQNPLGNLVSVPLQFNFNNGGDLGDRTLANLNLQPVVPIEVSEKWSVIARTIIPFLSIPLPGGSRESGIGDIQAEIFVTPAKPGAFVWGLGPILSLPTATADSVRTGSWAVGPAGVGVLSHGSWVVGALVTQAWTLADSGDDGRVNQLLVQPFINYNFGQGWAVVTAPMITASWDHPADDTWTVPVGGGLSWTTHIGHQPVNLGAQYYYNVERPEGAGANQLRLVVSLLFPTGPNQAAQKSAPTPADR